METLEALAIAAVLGFLVGLQREWSAPHLAGIRTFPLITVLGALLAMVSKDLGPWPLSAGMLGVAAFVVTMSVLKVHQNTMVPGLTTAMAALVMYAVGASLMLGHTAPSVAVGGGVAVLLQWKRPLHNMVQRFGEDDIRRLFQVVLIGLVVLPVMPNETYGPYEVINPFKIWLLVVLICGISVLGYIVYRFLGAGVGTLAGGVLGGIISSTATTVSYARYSREAPAGAHLAAVVVMIASTIVFCRVLFEVWLVAPGILPEIYAPMLVMMLFTALVSAVFYFAVRGEKAEAPIPGGNQLRAAMVFGALYAIVLLGIAAAKDTLGQQGLYLVAAVSGLTDMDAITLSTAQLVKTGEIASDTGWRLILVGFMSNMVFKAGVVGVLGTRRMFATVCLLFGVVIAGGAALVLLWPSPG
jgi:uncharacterized membrane protein (DUF4010 family)